jgi:UDP-N-acetylglucosamine 2-epimerase (non-hydrolysing)
MAEKKKIFLVAAARPNFMKIAPLYHSLKNEAWALPRIIHTGQHYDLNMSDTFFRDLELPEPYVNLGVGSGTHAEQSGKTMIAFEQLAVAERPDLTVVVGDVNATMACTIAAVKLGLKVAHLEAGLRSFDRTMPEEINRIVTDSLADLLWTPSPDGDDNLLKEGVDPEKIERVGNIMIDSFEFLRSKIEQEDGVNAFALEKRNFAVVTLHRPSNVDEKEKLEAIVDALLETSAKLKVLFPVHPRTFKRLQEFGVYERASNCNGIILTNPLNYIKFMNLVLNARMVITDSGGIQEETTYLGIPCLTLRDNTERPITSSLGTNRLCNAEDILTYVDEIMTGAYPRGSKPELWDGQTARRVVKSIKRFLQVLGGQESKS